MATATLPDITLEPVQSSRLAAIGYDPDQFALYVRFPATKKSPAGKLYRYDSVSEEIYDDLKHAESVGNFFGETIVKHPESFPYTCLDEGLGDDNPPEPAAAVVDIPDDEEGLKTLALATRSEATALAISTAEECEAASIEVLRVRAQRKLAIEKVNKIKIPATQAWKAACDLFNEVDGRYAEAEKYLDGGILAYRAAEKRRAAEESAAAQRKLDAEREAAIQKQREEHQRLQAEAQREAEAKAKELAEADARAAEAQGVSAEVVEAIRENPLPVTVRTVAPPPLAFVQSAAPVTQQNIPKVQGLGFTVEWLYEIRDESQIPLTTDFYTLDPKKIAARVRSLKQHANIPGVRVYSEERSIKRSK